MRLGAFAHLDEQRVIDPQIVIRDIVAVDAEGQFERPVQDRIVRLGQVLDVTRADPFAHVRHLAHPAIAVGLGRRRHDGRHLRVLRRTLGQAALERIGKTNAQGIEGGGVDDHGCVSSLRRAVDVFVEPDPDADGRFVRGHGRPSRKRIK